MKIKINLIIRLVIGWFTIFIGIISLPTPIPGTLIILLGFTILGEKRIINKIKELMKRWKKINKK